MHAKFSFTRSSKNVLIILKNIKMYIAAYVLIYITACQVTIVKNEVGFKED